MDREQALRGLRLLLWPGPTPALLESADGRILDLNPAAAALLVHLGEPLVGRETISLLPEPHRAGAVQSRLERNRAASDGGPMSAIRLRIDAGDGRPRWFTGVPQNVGGTGAADGSDPPRWLFLLHDVTAEVLALREKERAESERDRAHHQVATAMSGANIVVATYDPVHGWQMPAATAQGAADPARPGTPLGGGPGNLVAGVRAEYVRPSMRAEYERLQTALREGHAAELRFALDHPELGERWLQVHVAPLPQAGGRRSVSVAMLDVTERERALAEAERLLREREAMFNLSAVGILVWSGHRIERANAAMAEIAGRSATELMTLDLVALHPDTRAGVEFERQIEAALALGDRFEGERRLRRSDGTLRWVHATVRTLPAADVTEAGAAPVPRFIGSFVDIDDKRRAREALALQADRTRAVLNSVLVGIVTVGEGGITWLNRSARRMFGGHLSDFVDQPIACVATSEPDHPLRRGDWLRRLVEGQGESFECQLQALDGRRFWVAGSAVLTHDGESARDLTASGERRVTFALLDIERRRQTETRVAAARSRLQRLIETAPLAIALFDPDTLHVQQANAAAAAFFERAPLPGMAPEDCCHPAQAAALRGWLEQARDGTPGSAAWTVEREGAAATAWDLRLARLAADDDTAPGGEAVLLLVASDVTTQRQAEEARLAAAIAQREALVREVHHRIKNNLQGVAGLLQHNARQHPEVATLLLEATSQVQAIAQVYGLQLGRRSVPTLAELLDAVATGVERSFGQPIRRLPVVPPTAVVTLPEPEAIPVALIVNELLVNALRHGAPGSARIELEPAAEAGVTIRVASGGRLPPGFDATTIRSGISGLGLVRALLPRRGAVFSLATHEAGEAADGQVEGGADGRTVLSAEVWAEVQLRPPRIRWPEPGDAAAATLSTPHAVVPPPPVPGAESEGGSTTMV